MSNHAGKLIVRILEKSGVKNVWGITGDSANFITEALFESPINFMHVRHEEAAGMACGAEAEVSGGLGVCIGSCGPGALHLINGLYEANKEHNPVLCLATHIPSGEIGTNYVQETDVFNLFTDCSVFCQYVQSVEQLPRIMGIAMQTAVSRKGVSVLLIPGDISSAVVKGDLNLKYTPHYTEEVITPCPESVRELADSINRSERVAIIAGKNAGVAAKEVTELANLLQAPVGFDLQGKATFESLVKNRLGCFDKHCKDYPMEMLSKADLILLTGVENPYMGGIPPKARVAYIDGFVDNIIKSHNTDHTIYGAPDETLRLLIPLLDSKTDSGYASDCE